MKTIEVTNNSIRVNNKNGFTLTDENLIINKDIDIFIYVIKSNYNLKINILENIKAIINIILVDSKIVLNYELEKMSTLTVNSFNVDTSSNIIINLQELSQINYNYSIISNIENKLEMFINHLGNTSVANIINHGINKNALLEFDIQAKILKNVINCVSKQDNKIIYLNKAKSIILPNLIVENNLVTASHNAYIGSFNEDSVFYLLTRGINKEKALSIMIKGILLGNTNNDYLFLSECLKLI